MVTRTTTRLSKKQAREHLIQSLTGPISGHTGPAGRQVTWTYRMDANMILHSTMNDGITQLEINFALEQLKNVTATKQGLMMHLADKALVSGPDAQHSYDQEWPLILDWTQHPGLKEQLLKYFTAVIA